MADLQASVKSRAVIKGQLTRFRNFIEGISQQIPDSMQVEMRLSRIEPLWEQFNSVQTSIEQLDPQSESHDEERENFESTYFEIISKARKLLPNETFYRIASNDVDNHSVRSMNTIANSNNNGDNHSSHSHSTQSYNMPNIKLPTLNLPTFDGTYDNWLFFRDTFKSIIHENSQISNIQKFHYLRVSLKGEASDLIKSLEVSAANYETAWGLLLERYENKPLLISNHYKAIISLPAMSKESHSGLRQILDGMCKHLRALEVLEQPVEHWDVPIIHIVSPKLDSITLREWEAKNTKGVILKLQDFTEFLKEKCRLLENLGLDTQISNKQTSQKYQQANSSSFRSKQSNSLVSVYNAKCVFCQREHVIYYCDKFLSLNPNARYKEAKRLRLCLNCLRKTHSTTDCRSSSCRKCSEHHNTLLHTNHSENTTASDTISQQISPASRVAPNACSSSTTTNVLSCMSHTEVLLSTAMVDVFDSNDIAHSCRAVLDNGSQTSFVTIKLCESLQLPLYETTASVSGIAQAKTNVKYKTNIKIKSRVNGFASKIDCLVTPRITEAIPQISIKRDTLKIPENIILADPQYYETNEIDLLIGADVYWDLVSVGQIKLGKNLPTLQKTLLGWTVSGKVNNRHMLNTNIQCNFSLSSAEIDSALVKFWEIESYKNAKYLSPEEQMCETHYKQNVTKNKEGRFIVTLPLKESISKLGNSKQSALKRFYSLEKRLTGHLALKADYANFMKEFEVLNHMSEVPNDDSVGFYLPHHCVVKESSTSTRVRVVFDASSKSTSGYSLNDLMMVGPTIQQDLLSIILRFRMHKIVVTADVTKMYRQVLLQPHQRRLQRILWRELPTDELKCYELNTVTYGMSAASFLAIRSLHQAAYDHMESHPQTSEIILRDFYVDDFLSGGDSVQEVIQIKREVTQILKASGFPLRKWLSNHPSVVEDLSKSDSIPFGEQSESKTLGLLWKPFHDTLGYDIRPCTQNRVTKRSMLSCIAQIFDPLGLLSPVTITAKILLQRLWQYKLSWDESVPQDVYTRWMSLKSNLVHLNQLEIPRHVSCTKPRITEVHGFSDASESAYGACIYMKTVDSSGQRHSHLMVAKTRVAPLKTLSVPRLELCAAVLLAELYSKLRDSTNINEATSSFWTDSKIVLSWIKGSPHLWKVFVANRITEIHNHTNPDDWHYISTLENPADLLSRGENPLVLQDSRLWWRGPDWLSSSENYPLGDVRANLNDCPEARNNSVTLVSSAPEFDIFSRFSKLAKLQRVVAYLLRFRHNLSLPRQDRLSGSLTVAELRCSLDKLVRLAQHECFEREIRILQQNKSLHNSSSILKLSPFLDKEGILRVGGRLRNSNYGFNKKHPMILPKGHTLTALIAEAEHIRLLHAGPQAILASLRDKFWPVSGPNLTKQIFRKCNRCARFEASNMIKYQMGDLPLERSQATRPFAVCGIDYAGPFLVRDRKIRNGKTTKAYVCLFICFSTRAIHLEIVGDLSTQLFLAALRRFMARRGKCSKMFSDNGTNFVGAKSIIYNFLKSNKDCISTSLAQDGVEWHFTPPSAPHFGGIWEAGVRSYKFHLKRVVGDSIFSFEEFSTITTQIEACLNSRPLSPLSDDPNDLEPLTPAHFLIGESLVALPEPDLTSYKENRLTRFQHLQQSVQSFWKRWSKEFISQLQCRQKWSKSYPNLLKPGSLVLIKEDNLPPLRWKLARVISVHPGNDGVVRVVTLKTKDGMCKRPSVKLCLLPTSE